MGVEVAYCATPETRRATQYQTQIEEPRMKKAIRIVMISLASALALTTANLYAHTALKASLPAAGAVVNMAPAELKLTFTEPVRLVKVEILHMGQHALDTGFKPTTEAKAEFVIGMPSLSPAGYTVNWSAIGDDGHTVSNSFAFTLDPDAPAAHTDEHDHEAAHAAHDHGADHDHAAAHAAHDEHH